MEGRKFKCENPDCTGPCVIDFGEMGEIKNEGMCCVFNDWRRHEADWKCIDEDEYKLFLVNDQEYSVKRGEARTVDVEGFRVTVEA